MEYIFGSENSVALSPFFIIVAGALVLAVIIFLVSVVIYLAKKIKVLTKVRYGFGGKPIFSILAIVAITLAIPLTLYASQRSIELVKLAREERDLLIEIYEEKVDEENYSVSFIAVPLIDNEPWKDKTYDITWVVEGVVDFEKTEKGRSSQLPSYFVKELPKGTYEVKVTAEGENFKVVKTQELILE